MRKILFLTLALLLVLSLVSCRNTNVDSDRAKTTGSTYKLEAILVMPNAKDVINSGSTISYSTDKSMDNIKAFYEATFPSLEAKGEWKEELDGAALTWTGTYTKENKRLIIGAVGMGDSSDIGVVVNY